MPQNYDSHVDDTDDTKNTDKIHDTDYTDCTDSTDPTRGLGGSGVAVKSRRSGEATSAAVLNHMSKSPKSLEVVDFCWDLPSHIAKPRYLQHFRPKMQLYLAAGGLQAKVVSKAVSTDKKRYRWWVAALSCRRNALQSRYTS